MQINGWEQHFEKNTEMVDAGQELDSVLIAGAGNGFRVPLTQTFIADALGLTPIHTNRVMRQLERDDLLERSNGWILLKDQARLAEISQFDARCFHLDAFRCGSVANKFAVGRNSI